MMRRREQDPGTPPLPPRLAVWLIQRAIPAEEWEGVLGDLEETLSSGPTSPLWRGTLWYWAQAVMICTGFLRHRMRRKPRATRTTDRRSGPSPSLTASTEKMNMHGWLQDLRVGFRLMGRNPATTGIALLTLALGIGASAAVFSLVSGILLRPLPYPDSDRLIAVWNTMPGVGLPQFSQSAALHFTYEDRNRTLASIGLWSPGSAAVTGEGEARMESGIWVTHGIMEALGMRPVIGRRFSAADDDPASPATVMLSFRYWQDAYGGSRDVIGRTLRVDGETCMIIGVAGPGRYLSDYNPALYLPLQIDRATTTAGSFSFRSLARLAPGVTLEQAVADMARLIPVHIEEFPGGFSRKDLEDSKLAPLVWPLRDEVLGDTGPRLWMIFGAALLVLFIAVANVANLVLVRGEAREQEMAVRAALGAGRGRLARQLLVEGASLSVIGGLLGIGLAYGALGVIQALSPGNLPRLHEVSIDPTVLLFALGLSVFAGIVFGLFPASRNRGGDLVCALRRGGGSVGTTRGRHRLRNGLVVGQIALTLVLLVGSGLMVRSMLELSHVDPGFRDPESVLTLRIEIPSNEISTREAVARTHEFVGERLAELPGVSSVGLTSKLPMGPGSYLDPVWFEGAVPPEGTPPFVLQRTWVGGGYFETLGIRLLAGRYLTADDASNRSPVVVVSEALAHRHWASPAGAIGRRISTGMTPGEGGWRVVVGVVGDVRDVGIAQEAPEITYWPLVTATDSDSGHDQTVYAPRSVSYAIRGDRVGTPGFLQEVRQTIASVNANLPPQGVRMLDEIVSGNVTRTSFMLTMLGIAAVVALILGAVGVYGVVSYVASQRSRELGLRMALGAQPVSVVRLVLGHGLVLSLTGVGVGLVTAYWGSRLMETFLFGVGPRDPMTFVLAGLALVPIALLACLVPARRAMRADPTRMLRLE